MDEDPEPAVLTLLAVWRIQKPKIGNPLLRAEKAA
jgi:hypothetical protein